MGVYPANSSAFASGCKSRLRMITLYQIASSKNGIVVGTGNKVEDFSRQVTSSQQTTKAFTTTSQCQTGIIRKKILLQFIFILLEKNLWVEFLKIDKKNASILMEIGGPEIVGDRKHLANTYKVKTEEYYYLSNSPSPSLCAVTNYGRKNEDLEFNKSTYNTI